MERAKLDLRYCLIRRASLLDLIAASTYNKQIFKKNSRVFVSIFRLNDQS